MEQPNFNTDELRLCGNLPAVQGGQAIADALLQLNERLDQLCARMDQRIDQLGNRVDELGTRLQREAAAR